MPTSKIRAIFTDLGNVLTTFGERTEWLWRFAQVVNPRVFTASAADHPEDMAAAKERFFERLTASGVILQAATDEERCLRLDTGEVSLTKLYETFYRAAIVSRRYCPPERFWYAYFAHHDVIPSMCQLLAVLRSGGRTPVIAATNGDGHGACDLVELKTWLRFDDRVMSWQAGYKKPDCVFYQICLSKASIVLSEPLTFEECAYFDDVAGYCEAFRNLGGHAYQIGKEDHDFPMTEKLQTWLEDLGLLPRV